MTPILTSIWFQMWPPCEYTRALSMTTNVAHSMFEETQNSDINHFVRFYTLWHDFVWFYMILYVFHMILYVFYMTLYSFCMILYDFYMFLYVFILCDIPWIGILTLMWTGSYFTTWTHTDPFIKQISRLDKTFWSID